MTLATTAYDRAFSWVRPHLLSICLQIVAIGNYAFTLLHIQHFLYRFSNHYHSMPYQFHSTNSFTTDDTPQFNQFNFLISSNLSLLQYIIHMFLLPFHFFSTASTIQSSIHQSLPFYHSINVLYLPSILY